MAELPDIHDGLADRAKPSDETPPTDEAPRTICSKANEINEQDASNNPPDAGVMTAPAPNETKQSCDAGVATAVAASTAKQNQNLANAEPPEQRTIADERGPSPSEISIKMPTAERVSTPVDITSTTAASPAAATAINSVQAESKLVVESSTAADSQDATATDLIMNNNNNNTDKTNDDRKTSNNNVINSTRTTTAATDEQSSSRWDNSGISENMNRRTLSTTGMPANTNGLAGCRDDKHGANNRTMDMIVDKELSAIMEKSNDESASSMPAQPASVVNSASNVSSACCVPDGRLPTESHTVIAAQSTVSPAPIDQADRSVAAANKAPISMADVRTDDNVSTSQANIEVSTGPAIDSGTMDKITNKARNCDALDTNSRNSFSTDGCAVMVEPNDHPSAMLSSRSPLQRVPHLPVGRQMAEPERPAPIVAKQSDAMHLGTGVIVSSKKIAKKPKVANSVEISARQPEVGSSIPATARKTQSPLLTSAADKSDNIRDLSTLRMNPPDFSKSQRAASLRATIFPDMSKAYREASEELAKSQDLLDKARAITPFAYQHDIAANFAELRSRYNYVSDLQLKPNADLAASYVRSHAGEIYSSRPPDFMSPSAMVHSTRPPSLPPPAIPSPSVPTTHVHSSLASSMTPTNVSSRSYYEHATSTRAASSSSNDLRDTNNTKDFMEARIRQQLAASNTLHRPYSPQQQLPKGSYADSGARREAAHSPYPNAPYGPQSYSPNHSLSRNTPPLRPLSSQPSHHAVSQSHGVKSKSGSKIEMAPMYLPAVPASGLNHNDMPPRPLHIDVSSRTHLSSTPSPRATHRPEAEALHRPHRSSSAFQAGESPIHSRHSSPAMAFPGPSPIGDAAQAFSRPYDTAQHDAMSDNHLAHSKYPPIHMQPQHRDYYRPEHGTMTPPSTQPNRTNSHATPPLPPAPANSSSARRVAEKEHKSKAQSSSDVKSQRHFQPIKSEMAETSGRRGSHYSKTIIDPYLYRHTSETDVNIHIIKNTLSKSNSNNSTSSLSRPSMDKLPQPKEMPSSHSHHPSQHHSMHKEPPKTSSRTVAPQMPSWSQQPAPNMMPQAAKQTQATNAAYSRSHPNQYTSGPSGGQTVSQPVPEAAQSGPINLAATRPTASGASAPATTFSPLDLSVKTVKTKADSTGVHEPSSSQRHLSAMPNSFKVDFVPNFDRNKNESPRNEMHADRNTVVNMVDHPRNHGHAQVQQQILHRPIPPPPTQSHRPPHEQRNTSAANHPYPVQRHPQQAPNDQVHAPVHMQYPATREPRAVPQPHNHLYPALSNGQPSSNLHAQSVAASSDKPPQQQQMPAHPAVAPSHRPYQGHIPSHPEQRSSNVAYASVVQAPRPQHHEHARQSVTANTWQPPVLQRPLQPHSPLHPPPPLPRPIHTTTVDHSLQHPTVFGEEPEKLKNFSPVPMQQRPHEYYMHCPPREPPPNHRAPPHSLHNGGQYPVDHESHQRIKSEPQTPPIADGNDMNFPNASMVPGHAMPPQMYVMAPGSNRHYHPYGPMPLQPPLHMGMQPASPAPADGNRKRKQEPSIENGPHSKRMTATVRESVDQSDRKYMEHNQQYYHHHHPQSNIHSNQQQPHHIQYAGMPSNALKPPPMSGAHLPPDSRRDHHQMTQNYYPKRLFPHSKIYFKFGSAVLF